MFDTLLNDAISIVLKTEIVPDTVENIIKFNGVPSWVQNTPISSLIVTTGNALVDYKNMLLVKRLTVFLLGVKGLDDAQRTKFEKTYLKDEKTKSKFYNDLFITIEKLDEERKSLFLSNIFRSLINEEISKEDFFRFSHIISALYIEYLDEFLKPFQSGNYKTFLHRKPDLNIIFESHGLVERTITTEKDSITIGKEIQKVKTKYKTTQFGLYFKKHCISSK